MISEAWVKQSFAPWIRSAPGLREPNYGNYFWTERHGPWTAHVANGWKGQRIAIVPAKDVVITMTADLEEGEEPVFQAVMQQVMAALGDAPLPEDVVAHERLKAGLTAANAWDRIPASAEPRMVPSVGAKERRHALVPLR